MTQLVKTINTGIDSVNFVFGKEISKTSKTEKKIFNMLLVTLFVVFALYVYFTSYTILNVIKRESAEKEIKTISSNISGLELEYLSLKNNLTLDYAHLLGFTEIKKINYISKKPENNGITLNETIK